MEYQLIQESHIGYAIFKRIFVNPTEHPDFEFVDVNRKFEELSEFRKHDLVGQRISDVYRKNSLISDCFELCRKAAGVGECETDVHFVPLKKWFRIHAAVLHGQYLAVSIVDITVYMDQIEAVKAEANQRQAELIYLAYHDQLTGICNRRCFLEELARLDRTEFLPMTVALCDVNGLKLINDSFGSELGDQLLKRLAEIFRTELRSGDVYSRYGGDEFSFILPKTNLVEAEELIHRIRGAIAAQKIGGFEISVSFGYGTKNDIEDDIGCALRSAEDMMFRNKLYENKSARSRSVDLIINTLYEKNHREMLHSKRVSLLCGALAEQLLIEEEEINKIRIAGLMHDIGKIGIDEKILNKNEKLSNLERIEIQKHPEIGYKILSAVTEFSEIAEYVLEHQERWDGTGYPRGLKAEGISVEARIIAICDAFDAMTGIRAYGRAVSLEEALEEIRKCAGTQFDPRLVRAFVAMQKEESLFQCWQHG